MHLLRPRTNVIPVMNEDTGKVGGYYTEHWDDHVDATVLVAPVAVVAKGSVMELAPGEREIIQRVNREKRG